MSYEEAYQYMVQDVINNAGNRELIFRWKNSVLERMIREATNKKAKFYVTRAKSRINNMDTFSDEILKGKQKEYYLVLDVKWNKSDADRYREMGFLTTKDCCFNLPKPYTVSTEKTDNLGGGREITDDYGNIITTKSKGSFIFTGINSSVIIGKNVMLPKSPIKIGSNSTVVIKDNCRLETASIQLADGCSLILNENICVHGMKIFVNLDSVVEIGKDTTMQTGKMRTGRNQIIRIGEDCMFSWDIVFLAHDGHLLWDIKERTCINNTIGDKRKSIILGNHIWIGGETVFLPNTEVASGSVCGYRSLVKGKVPNNCIVAGSPAKIIRKDIAWTREAASLDEKDYFKLHENYRKRTIEQV